ncbi:hypothetical protein EPA93_23905 [Ktedonosporobacter rubrisoli]|uniref:Uncharacterized protein n=1 Tax=Ktedonosporobacter rubrisoli TaxID=2509675 RepID=A0A4P6JU74_KTERU|nr:hypothetical protein [Ktedonosporobacter rubrisoli]QBD78860.1 hypothetical protein EPA93_23905 [Ktedonosporobacter rubrisoli]
MDKQYRPGDKMGEEPTAEQEQDMPAELLRIARLYREQPLPSPSPEAAQKLFAHLMAVESSRAGLHVQRRLSLSHTLRLAGWQIRFLGPWFWIFCVLLLSPYLLIISTLPDQAVGTLIIMLPLTALLSVVYALRQLKRERREVEECCPTSRIEIMAGLVLAIVCFDVLFGLFATIVVTMAHWAPFAQLFAAWLGPLLLLVGISFPIALRYGVPAAFAVGAGPWVLLIGLSLLFPGLNLGQFFAVGQSLAVFCIQLLAAGLGAFILGHMLLRGSRWQDRLQPH